MQVSIKAQVIFDACWRRCEETYGEASSAAHSAPAPLLLRALLPCTLSRSKFESTATSVATFEPYLATARHGPSSATDDRDLRPASPVGLHCDRYDPKTIRLHVLRRRGCRAPLRSYGSTALRGPAREPTRHSFWRAGDCRGPSPCAHLPCHCPDLLLLSPSRCAEQNMGGEASMLVGLWIGTGPVLTTSCSGLRLRRWQGMCTSASPLPCCIALVPSPCTEQTAVESPEINRNIWLGPKPALTTSCNGLDC